MFAPQGGCLHHAAPDRIPTQGNPMAHNTTSALQALIKKLRGLLSRVAGGTPNRQQHPEPATPAAQLPEPQAPVRTRRANPGKKPHKPAPPTPTAKPAAPACPHCRKTMVIKVARTGKNAGEFWGCVAYPKCRGIRPIFR
ncbi:DNA topoisomerase domain protein [Pseudomonas syringae pv. syringae SM]|nr:DNA topoisomerase domain protein [Pseudomonas syringae pv. syringae SM]